nr:heat-inducible transcription repressor HrcA [Deltaproteobacteria bacterium]
VGSLGVIGPIRMDYSKVIPLVGYMAQILSELLEDL